MQDTNKEVKGIFEMCISSAAEYPKPAARLRRDTRGRDGGVREELAAGEAARPQSIRYKAATSYMWRRISRSNE
jgi:hypothetical protein